MKTVGYIVTRIFAFQFYRNNAALFVLFLAFAFGFLTEKEHLALASYFVSSPNLMIIPLVAWSLYTVFIVDSNRKLSQKNENQFLCDVFLYPLDIQCKVFAWASFLQMIPILAYAFFLVQIAFQNDFFLTGSLIVVGTILLLIVVTYRLRYTIMPVTRQKKSFHFPLFNSIPRLLTFLPIENIFRRQLLATIGYKISAVLLLSGILQVYKHEPYDIRLLGLAVLISFSLSVQFILEWHQFENTAFSLLRQLPFSRYARSAKTIITIVCYCLPEIIVVLLFFPGNLEILDRVSVVTYGLSIPFLFFNFLYCWNRPLEKVMSPVYFFVIGSFLLILCKIPLLALMALQFLIAIWIHARYYYRYDYSSRQI